MGAKTRDFSEYEDNLICTHYPQMGAARMIKNGYCADRTPRQVRVRAKELGVRMAWNEVPAVTRSRWWDYPVELLGIAPRAVLA